MPKYRVQVDETVVYKVDVEAADEEAAGKAAIEVLVQATDINQYFMEVTEREAAFVEEIKGV